MRTSHIYLFIQTFIITKQYAKFGLFFTLSHIKNYDNSKYFCQLAILYTG